MGYGEYEQKLKMKKILTILLLLLACATAQAQTIVHLPGTKATLECHPANNSKLITQNSQLSVVVCPGGSYSWLDYQVEGLAAHADSLGIDPTRIGIMGFSAGGHLAMLSTYTRQPAFVAPIYPVVTMRQACCHTRSRRALLGEYGKYKQTMRGSLSLELHVRPDCPPVFLVNCVDDPIVDYHNSELLDSALTANNIPHRYIQYRTGGHGFGMSDTRGSDECRSWREEFLKWLQSINLKKQP